MTAEPRFSVAFQSDKTIPTYERLAARAEAAGFDLVSVFGDLYFQPPIGALLAMARATRRVALGPACLNPFTLHPVEIAGQIALLDEASGGRAYVGLARGTWLGELGIEQSRPVEAVVEAAAVVAALLAGHRDGVEGQRFRLPAGALLATPPRRDVPILVGTWGPRLVRAAAGFASEVKVGGSANPALVPVVRDWLDGAGGDRVGVVLGAVTVVDRDRAAARRRARREVAMYLEVVAGLDPTLEVDPALLESLRGPLSARDHEAAGALVPNELLDRFAFAGTPEQVADHAAELIEAGCSRVEFGTPHGLDDDTGVALLGAEVLPRLRAAFP